MEKLKVLVVDDDVMQRKNITEIVKKTGMGSVVHASSNGTLALEWLEHNDVDVALLDVVLPGECNADILKYIKKEYARIEVILLCDGTPGSVEVTLEGLKYGALDFIQKPSGRDYRNSHDGLKNQLMILFSQIKIKMNSIQYNFHESTATRSASKPLKSKNSVISEMKANQFDPLSWDQADLVLIAASTGGPAALEVVCSMFPSDFDKPVLIVQHIPGEFTKALVEALDRKCLIQIAEGKDQGAVSHNQILIAPGGAHMVIEKRGSEKFIRLINTPHVNGVRPAADVLFKSAAGAYEGKNILAVILTGMGNDGMAGIMELKKKCNCYCIIQSEQTCVVYGMPRSVHEAGLADEVVDLYEITSQICKITSGRS
ncbi:MAG: chemotaxis-specific protein-glutamate methyltransferase CheB [Syntrophomonadaceae bacterium]|nr:chemotaxis-specific protein-glutamate methyltransferase CheB [Syntrophomonadaceae bacterium]MDD3024378.1 chemotaxis-specific protein-glutamate methyltransferase CheB [Syntrophomonadaceae bacterium]